MALGEPTGAAGGGPEVTTAGPPLALLLRARLWLIPLLAIVTALQPGAHLPGLALATALGTLWTAGTAWRLRPGAGRRPRPNVLMAGDLAAVALVALMADGDRSVAPFVALLGLCLLSPVPSTATRITLHVVFGLCIGTPLLVDEALVDGMFPTATCAFVVALTIAYLLTSLNARLERGRSELLAELLLERTRLLSDVSDLVDADRRRSSQALHDTVLQTLLAARQDLDQAARGTAEGSADLVHAQHLLRSSIGALRSEVATLDPGALAGPRLPGALRALVDAHYAQGARIEAELDHGASGEHDTLLFAVGRQLLDLLVDRARTRDLLVTVRLARAGGRATLELARHGAAADDRTAEQAAMSAATLAWVGTRLREAGGGLEVSVDDGGVARAMAHMPLAADTAGAPDAPAAPLAAAP